MNIKKYTITDNLTGITQEIKKYYSITLTDKKSNYILVVSDIWSISEEDAQKKLSNKIIELLKNANFTDIIQVKKCSIYEA